MLGRHVYRVRPHEGGIWQVGKEGADERSPRAALAFAGRLACAGEPSRGAGGSDAIEDRTQFGG
jgi:hypothetical protein